MRALENRIPPPILAILVAVLMWLFSTYLPRAPWIADPIKYAVAGALTLIGALAAGAGFAAFGRARTTIDPVNIDGASALVTDGIYRLSRNPMYVGLTTILLGWAVFLASPWTFVGPIVFMGLIQRLQIMPEERVMLGKFGGRYEDYCRTVRRWL